MSHCAYLLWSTVPPVCGEEQQPRVLLPETGCRLLRERVDAGRGRSHCQGVPRPPAAASGSLGLLPRSRPTVHLPTRCPRARSYSLTHSCSEYLVVPTIPQRHRLNWASQQVRLAPVTSPHKRRRQRVDECVSRAVASTITRSGSQVLHRSSLEQDRSLCDPATSWRLSLRGLGLPGHLG